MKIKGPLLAKEARGTIATFLTFSKKKSGQQARWQNKNKDANSAGQAVQRAKFLNASLSCRFPDFGEAYFGIAIFGREKSQYIAEAKDKNLTGYNLCVQESLEEFL